MYVCACLVFREKHDSLYRQKIIIINGNFSVDAVGEQFSMFNLRHNTNRLKVNRRKVLNYKSTNHLNRLDMIYFASAHK